MTKTFKYVAAVAAFVAAGAATADITLFENDNYNGRRLRSTTSVSNLVNLGFNDRASSVIIHNGEWQICSDAYFRGRCVTLGPGDYPSLRSMGLNDSVSSVRELWDRAVRSPPPAVAGGGGGGANLILYDGYDLGGNSYPVGGFIANLDGSGFNDRAQSIIVYDGTWELCEDSDFRGSCLVYGPGRYANLGALGGRVSSLRPARGAGGGIPSGGIPSGGIPGGGNWGGGNRAILYEGPELTGRVFVVNQSITNLNGTGFNDRASSLRIERGYWLFCSDAGFQGECRTFGPGDYPTLPYGLTNRISSGRRISDDYPYRNNPNWGGPR